jgi:hypothetical protein
VPDPVAAPDLSPAALLTLGEARAALKLTTAEQNPYLCYLINAASERWELETGRRLKARTYVAEYRYIELDHVYQSAWLDWEWPITAIDTLEVDAVPQVIWLPGDAGSPDDADVYCLEDRDRLFRWDGWPEGALVRRTYTAGYGVVPSDLREAVAQTVRHFYYLQDRQQVGIASRSTGAETITYIDTPMPVEALAVIRAYKRWRPW